MEDGILESPHTPASAAQQQPIAVGAPKSLRILSLDGGGIKGYTTLLILKRIFRQLGYISGSEREPRPCDVFDLIVGTSTGGLIATMLGRLKMPIDECLEKYENLSKRVFGKQPAGGQFGRLLKGLANSSFYDIEALQAAIKDVLNDKKMPLDTRFCENSGQCKV